MINVDVSLYLTDGARLNDLCCFWTGCDYLPPRKEILGVKFNKNQSNKLPTAETCFMSQILPVGHDTYEKFKNSMDTAILYGCRGFSFA